MTEPELKLLVAAVFKAGNDVSQALAALAGKDPQGLVGVHVFIANQNLQDCMNRTSNIAALMKQLTDENVEKTVDEAIAKPGGLTVLPGG